MWIMPLIYQGLTPYSWAMDVDHAINLPGVNTLQLGNGCGSCH